MTRPCAFGHGGEIGDFDPHFYLLANPDVAAAVPKGTDPATFAFPHYETYGWKEGRDPSTQFDTHQYLAHYTDVAAAHMDPLQHYLDYGAWENRVTFGDGKFG